MLNDELKRYEHQYRSALLEDVIPFWMKHSPDRVHGGYYHHLDRDGSLYDTQKYVWLENREVWMFSTLYNKVEKRPEWLEMATLGADFLRKHGRNEDGDWYFCLTEDGRPVIQPYNIFSDCFAVMGFSEYARATGSNEALDIAVSTYDRIQKRKDNPKGIYNKLIFENRPLKNLALPMININMSTIMNEIRPDPKYDEIIVDSMAEIMNQFVSDKHRLVFENITTDGKLVDTCEGRHINPGHGIECMWFIMSAAHQIGDMATVKKACEVSKWCMDFGWDDKHDGFFYFMDKDHKPHFELQWDMKLWWPHVEALIAFMLGYKLTGDEDLLKRFRMVHEYTWSHFPDKEYGEWFGYLNRQGEVNNTCKGNHWKGCFHLPRALHIISEICSDLQKPE